MPGLGPACSLAMVVVAVILHEILHRRRHLVVLQAIVVIAQAVLLVKNQSCVFDIQVLLEAKDCEVALVANTVHMDRLLTEEIDDTFAAVGSIAKQNPRSDNEAENLFEEMRTKASLSSMIYLNSGRAKEGANGTAIAFDARIAMRVTAGCVFSPGEIDKHLSNFPHLEMVTLEALSDGEVRPIVQRLTRVESKVRTGTWQEAQRLAREAHRIGGSVATQMPMSQF